LISKKTVRIGKHWFGRQGRAGRSGQQDLIIVGVSKIANPAKVFQELGDYYCNPAEPKLKIEYFRNFSDRDLVYDRSI
jgi:hypothetical protein